MEIRKTRLEELDQVMEVYAHARKFMAEHNNPNQWKNNKPTREQIEKDISRYKECFSKISNCSIKGHYILSENLRCTVYENGYSVFVNFGDKEEKHGDITVSAKDFIIVKEALK